jgi:peptidyl-prolyl cis-trans isomerase C
VVSNKIRVYAVLNEERGKLMSIKKAGVMTLFSAKGAVSKLVTMALGLFFLAAASGDCFGAKPEEKDVVAKWGKNTIRKQELEMRLNNLPPEGRAQFQTNDQKKMLLENMIYTQIIAAEARSQKLDKKASVTMTIKDMTNSILVQEYFKLKVESAKKLSESDIETFYKAHKGEYVTPGQVKAQHILLRLNPDAKPEEITATTAKAEDICKEIKAGGDFAKLADKYSDDPGSKSKGGDLGFFSEEQMVPEFSKAAFALKKNEVSGPVKTDYGIHIIKVTDITPERQMELKDAVPAIRARMEEEGRKEIVKKELERLKIKYKVQIEDIN